MKAPLVVTFALVLGLTGALGGVRSAQAHPAPFDRDGDDRLILIREPPPPPPPPPPPSIIVAHDPAPPAKPRRTWLGVRTGVGSLPLRSVDSLAVGLLQLTGDVELTAGMRAFGEYEFLIVSDQRSDSRMQSRDGVGHRGNLGLAHEIVAGNVRNAHLYITAEAGAGSTRITGTIGGAAGGVTMLHGFAGVRFGIEIRPEDATTKPERSIGFELLVRGIAVPDGAGLVFGLGLVWGG